MGLFGKSEEEKKKEDLKKHEEEQEKTKEALQALGVDFDSYSNDELKEKNKINVLGIRAGMPTDIMSQVIVGASLKNAERITIMKLSDIVSQNWILIRQNELISRYLKKLLDSHKK